MTITQIQRGSMKWKVSLVIAYPFKGRRACPWVRGNENGLRRHDGGGDVICGWREGSTDISRFAGLLVDVQYCGAGGLPTLVAKK